MASAVVVVGPNPAYSASHSVARQRGSLSFHCERVIRTAAWHFLEDDELRDYRKRREHQKLIVVDVCDDLRLLRDVASSAARPTAVTSVLRTSSTLEYVSPEGIDE
jgi:hypothetical protein